MYKQCDTRTKDLIDMVLLIRGDKLDKDKTVAAVRATFLKRATHDVPKELDPPPAEWEPVFGALAEECDLPMNLGGDLNWFATSKGPSRPNTTESGQHEKCQERPRKPR
jgi:hypothetical protein